ncbi:zeta toxin family protein [Delftia acidovorans]|uniref:zeta toxin family protein n=1 Tax=Delftia acidovorans TaxID=80866 RepID=UPI0035A0BBC2
MLSQFIDQNKNLDVDCTSLCEDSIKELSRNRAKLIRTEVARRVVTFEAYKPEPTPTSIFMAGTPGSGKTEWRVNFFREQKSKIVHIDPDDFRCILPCYTGNNSHLFQSSVSLITERILDKTFEKGLNFVLDGTLSSWASAQKNIKRSLDRNRLVQVYFMHQDPVMSWQFSQARELVEGRRITVDAFVNSYFGCKNVLQQILSDEEFSLAIKEKKLSIDMLIRNSDRSRSIEWQPRISISNMKNIFPEHFTEAALRGKIQPYSSLET